MLIKDNSIGLARPYKLLGWFSYPDEGTRTSPQDIVLATQELSVCSSTRSTAICYLVVHPSVDGFIQHARKFPQALVRSSLSRLSENLNRSCRFLWQVHYPDGMARPIHKYVAFIINHFAFVKKLLAVLVMNVFRPNKGKRF